MNAFQACHNTSDAAPLYLPLQLYLKPVAKINISLQLPPKTMGKTISNWEIMEKLRSLIVPDEFITLKVTKTTLEFLRFEAEIDDKKNLDKVITKLNNKLIKLKIFNELLKLRAGETKSNFPIRHDWDTFFREAKDMNEMKPGERPDTIHISNLPIKWFVPYHLSESEDLKPSEKIFYRVFEKFGRIRHVDIPICDPYRNKMKSHISGMQIFSFEENQFFEGYVQFKDYIGFSKTMDAFRDMKLLRKEGGEVHTVTIYVDFDKTKHLSDASIRRREIVRDRLIAKTKEKEEIEKKSKEAEELKIQMERQKEIELKTEKEKRRRAREERRKARILSKLKLKGTHEINDKIALEEKKLLRVQRKLEAIRLVEELFKRIEKKKEKDTSLGTLSKGEHGNEILKMKSLSEQVVHQQREKLHQAIEGRAILKSILADSSKVRSKSSETSDSNESNRKETDLIADTAYPSVVIPPVADWYGYPSNLDPIYQANNVYPMRSHMNNYFSYSHRARGMFRGSGPGPSRGYSQNRRYHHGGYPKYRGRGVQYSRYPPELEHQYYRYFQQFLHTDYDARSQKSYSRSRTPSRQRSSSKRKSRSRRRSSSSSRSRRKSYSRSSSRNRRSRNRSRSSSYYRSRFRNKSKIKSRSKRSNHRYSSSRSRSRKSDVKRKHPSRSRSKSKKRDSKEKSRSPSYRSIDSSKFISPSRLRMPRSKSWSLPRETSKKRT